MHGSTRPPPGKREEEESVEFMQTVADTQAQHAQLSPFLHTDNSPQTLLLALVALATAQTTNSAATRTEDYGAVGACPVIRLDKATVRDSEGEHHQIGKEHGALLDSGSTVSYVSSKLLQKLPHSSYKILTKDIALSIKVLQGQTQTVTAKLVQLALHRGRFVVPLLCLCLDTKIADSPKFCGHVSAHLKEILKNQPNPFNQAFNHCLDFGSDFEIDLLIGIPYVYKIMLNKKPLDKLENLWALATPFGSI